MRLLALPLLALLFLLAACSDGDSGGGDGNRLRVVATTTQIGDFAANVGADRIDLTVLLEPNQDAHDFEMEPSQIRAVAEADLVLRNGLGLDAFLDRALEGSAAAVATVSERVETREGGHEHDEEGDEEGDEDDHGADPHVWLSVENARVMVENVRDALMVEDGANADFYAGSTGEYLDRLDALDAEIRAQVAAVPEACRKLVTNHDVLGYYAHAYGFEVVGSVIPSTAADAQPSAADVAEVVRTIREQNVPAVFAEASVNSALIEQVGREAGVEVVEGLYTDSLGPEGSDGATYIDMMRANTAKMVGALRGCEG